MTFTDAAEWLSAITDVQIDGTSWKKVDYTSLVYDNAKYYVNADDGRILIGEGFVMIRQSASSLQKAISRSRSR